MRGDGDKSKWTTPNGFNTLVSTSNVGRHGQGSPGVVRRGMAPEEVMRERRPKKGMEAVIGDRCVFVLLCVVLFPVCI